MPDARNNGPRRVLPRLPRRRLRRAEVEDEAATGFRFHGPRFLLLAALAVATYLFFPVSAAPDLPRIEPGMVPAEDLIAAVDFDVPKPLAQLRLEQAAAEAAVEPTYVYEPAAVDTVRARVTRLLDRFDAAFELGLSEAETRARLQAALTSANLQTLTDPLTLLRPAANRNLLRNALLATINEDLTVGVGRARELDNVITSRIRFVRNSSDPLLLRRDEIMTERQLHEEAGRHLPARAPAGLAELQRLVLTSTFVPSVQYDAAQTEESRDNARMAVDSIKASYLAGERVLTAHERVDEEDIERLQAYEARLSENGELALGLRPWWRVAGMLLINTMVLLIFGVLLHLYRPHVYGSPRALLLLAILLFTVVSAASVVTKAGLSPALIPIAFPALVAAMLWDGRLALTFALVIAILLTMQAPLGELSRRVLLVTAGAAAALSVRAVHRRAHGLILGAIVAAAYLFASLGAGLLLTWEWNTVLTHTLYGTANGLAAALIAVGLMPVFEMFTGITTDQTLLELGDLNRPLLKRLSLEAAGTYAHSINVAHLAEAAARAIDANPLLARVGAYYHDIGKIADPEFFVENQARGRNPHDALPPRESAAIVRRHVLEGMRLADEANLPANLKAFITEHHGTQLIGFFYDKAQETEGGSLAEGEFRYPGPRPRSQETAILMLADSVESAAKALDDPTPEAIRELVDRIVQAKLDRGELDEAPVTLRDLKAIKDAFLTVLSGLYHQRLDYPAAVTAPLRVRPAGGGR